MSNLALMLDARFLPEIHGRLKVHLLDLYDRNPTSSDDRVHLREAWPVFGQKEERESPQGSGFFCCWVRPRVLPSSWTGDWKVMAFGAPLLGGLSKCSCRWVAI
ncbi:MAG: hypothetical protein NZ869_03035 [Thermoanaerobaculum sp.]|nr:hypothetical protein [Thermoanaerobaculum sp.]